jgi:alpha/beta hydrolase family protein
MTAMSDRPFRFRGRACCMTGMPYPTAELHLRGSAPIRVIWTGAAPAPLVVHVGRAPRLDFPAVVLTVTNFDDAVSALQWCADHGAELGGDPDRLIIAGDRESASVVAALARHARDRGWPPIERTVITRGGTMTVTETYFAISRHLAVPRERLFDAWLREDIAFSEIDAPRRLVFEIEHGGLAIVTLADEGDETVMTFEGSAPDGEADEVERGWAAMLDDLIAGAQGSQSGGNAGGIRPG